MRKSFKKSWKDKCSLLSSSVFALHDLLNSLDWILFENLSEVFMSSELELKKEETSEESGFDVQGIRVELKDVKAKVEELNKVNARVEGELKELKARFEDLEYWFMNCFVPKHNALPSHYRRRAQERRRYSGSQY